MAPVPLRLLLISTSTVHGTAFLEHAFEELRDFLGRISRVLFLPYALKDHQAYAASVRAAFASIGFRLDSLHEAPSPADALERAEAVFTGGGNTFRLLETLYCLDVVHILRDGMPYAGASAGSNLACPTIRTTNDMPIVEPPTLDALGLVSFQINPHYVDPDPRSTHMGETRATRILEFHEENAAPVIGLREGAMLRVDGGSVLLKGIAGARIFRRGQEPIEILPVARLEPFLS